MDIDFELYRIFHAVAQYANITKAAYALHISQPAVSKAIKNLEAQLGATVFIRTKKGVTLTAEGRELYTFIDRAVSAIKNGENRFTDMMHLEKGTLTIGVGATVAKHFLLDYLKCYHTLHPQINIHIITGKTDDLIENMKQGTADIVFVNTRENSFSDMIELTACKTIQDCFVASNAFESLKNLPLHLEQLNEYPLLLPAHGSETRTFLDNICVQQGYLLNAQMELAGSSMLRAFAKADFGITFCAKEYIEEEINNKELFVLNVVEPIPPRTISYALLKHQMVSFATKALIDLILSDKP